VGRRIEKAIRRHEVEVAVAVEVSGRDGPRTQADGEGSLGGKSSVAVAEKHANRIGARSGVRTGEEVVVVRRREIELAVAIEVAGDEGAGPLAGLIRGLRRGGDVHVEGVVARTAVDGERLLDGLNVDLVVARSGGDLCRRHSGVRPGGS